MLIAPTEPKEFTKLGKVSSIPEKHGVDFYWPRFKAGVQRKTVTDFIASIHDGRLQKEAAQMQGLTVRMVIVEGRTRWTLEGELAGHRRKQYRKSGHYGLLWSLRAKGIWVDLTDSKRDTIERLRWFDGWIRKAKHSALDRRPGPEKNVWGKAGSPEFARHLLMGLEGVGPELADRIVQEYDGVPWQWTVTEEELCEIEGIGPKTASKMISALK